MSKQSDFVVSEYKKIARKAHEATGRILPVIPEDEMLRMLNEISPEEIEILIRQIRSLQSDAEPTLQELIGRVQSDQSGTTDESRSD